MNEKIDNPNDNIEELNLKKLEALTNDRENAESYKLPEMPNSLTHNIEKKEKRQKIPIIDPFSGYYYARKMHMNNLLHHPLPDTLGSKATNLRPVPGRDLDVKPYSSTWLLPSNKLEERPLTCTGVQKSLIKTHKYKSMRPATTEGEKEKQIKGKSVSQMDLAICWDFKTSNPRDEPKRPKHIDGSNGSLAPAVFSMVHSPKVDLHVIPDTGRSNAIFSHNIIHNDLEDERVVPCFEKDMSKNKRKEACETPMCPQHLCYEKNGSKNGKERKNSKDSNKSESCDGIHGCGSTNSTSTKASTKLKKKEYNNKVLKENHPPNIIIKEKQRRRSLDHSNDDLGCSLNDKSKLCQSSPNISKNNNDYPDEVSSSYGESSSKSKNKNHFVNRSCMACSDKKVHDNEVVLKPEYKMAFKAGKPNSLGSSEKTSESSSNSKTSVRVPKMRDPYGKKSYAIPTLAPPFSRWHDTSGYPEHWRLASVYQHAYKPPGPKRRPLLPSVYQ